METIYIIIIIGLVVLFFVSLFLYVGKTSHNSSVKGGKKRYHKGATGKDKIIYDEVVRLLKEKESVMNIHRKTGVSRNTVYKIQHEMEPEVGRDEAYGN